jgi:Delta3-Delta2-enoyl-CoA isomerase
MTRIGEGGFEMGMISTERRGNVCVVWLDRNITNAINMRCVEELGAMIQQLSNDPGVSAVVLSSSSAKFFSIGFDIPELYDQSREEFGAFYQAVNQMCLDLYALPKPTVAAITGHAIAGGCILTLCCDYRFIASGRKLIGLNEVKLGVPVPYPADRMLRELVGMRPAREIMEAGEFYEPERALALGLVDRVLTIERLVDEAVEMAAELGSLPGAAYAMIKANRVENIVAEVQAHGAEKERAFIERWYSDETRKLLREAIKKY